MMLLSVMSMALAGSVYINGVRADVLPETTLASVSVRFDAQGNTWIDAPNYRVQVIQPSDSASAALELPRAPEAPPGGGVGPGIWWLVTEDSASAGHVIDISVNGAVVHRVSSGDAQVILDIGPWLRPGPNMVLMNPLPARGGTSGSVSIYAGKGSTLDGTLHLDNPDVKYARRSSDSAGGVRQYTLTVP